MALYRSGGAPAKTLANVKVNHVDVAARTYTTVEGHYYLLIASTDGVATAFPTTSQYTVVSPQVSSPNTRAAIVVATGTSIVASSTTSIHECYELTME